MSTYWAIAAGSAGRGYSKLFLKFGMAFVGNKTIEQVEEEDIVILRSSTKILAVGEARKTCTDGEEKGEHKEWLEDVDGWSLCHYRYVNWKEPKKVACVKGLSSRGAAISRIHNPNAKKVADEILATGRPPEETGYKEPEKTKLVADQELLETLNREGLNTSPDDELKNRIKNIQDLAGYYNKYYRYNANIPEHEARTFLVVPLLLALGWSERQIKIELSDGKRKRIDIACFSKPYKPYKPYEKCEEPKENCVAIIETKGFASGLDYALRQADSYSNDFPNCKALITTNGYCYKIYLKDEKGSFPKDPYDPSAYINLLNPRDKYPLNPKEGNGALDAIKWLLPNNLI